MSDTVHHPLLVTMHNQLLAFHPLLSTRLAPIARELERDYVRGMKQPTAQSENRVTLELSHGLVSCESLGSWIIYAGSDIYYCALPASTRVEQSHRQPSTGNA
jgi:hypothetical protein